MILAQPRSHGFDNDGMPDKFMIGSINTKTARKHPANSTDNGVMNRKRLVFLITETRKLIIVRSSTIPARHSLIITIIHASFLVFTGLVV